MICLRKKRKKHLKNNATEPIKLWQLVGWSCPCHSLEDLNLHGFVQLQLHCKLGLFTSPSVACKMLEIMHPYAEWHSVMRTVGFNKVTKLFAPLKTQKNGGLWYTKM